MTKPEVQTVGTDESPEGLGIQTPPGSDTVSVLAPQLVPTTDLDALRSIKDKEIAAERKQRLELEGKLLELQQQLTVEVSRRQLAESTASESQAQVNLRNFARQLAVAKYGVWGPEVQKAAEEKFLTAENRNHLAALEHEFATADLPQLSRQESGDETRKERERKALDATVGLTTARLPTTPPPTSEGDLAEVDKYLSRARIERIWKETPEGVAALRKSREVLAKYGYPASQIRDWATVANALSSIRLIGGETVSGPKRVTKI